MRNKGGFKVRFPNNKVLKFHSREAYSNVMEVMMKGRYRDVGQMFAAAKGCFNGYEFAMPEHKAKEVAKRFNSIDFED